MWGGHLVLERARRAPSARHTIARDADGAARAPTLLSAGLETQIKIVNSHTILKHTVNLTKPPTYLYPIEL